MMPSGWERHPTKLAPSEYRALCLLQDILQEPTLNSTIRRLIKDRVQTERNRQAVMLRESKP